MKKLQKCCGQVPSIYRGSLFGYYVKCANCRRTTKIYGMEHDAIKDWNFNQETMEQKP